MRTNGLSSALSILPLLLCGLEVSAQESVFLDAVEVKVASVEVVVEGEDGRNLSGLTAADFEIIEDGVRQPIEYFSAQENGKLVSSDGESAVAPTDRLHLAIFVDDAFLSPQNRNQVFGNLKEYLRSELRPTDLVLIARIGDQLVIEQQFTDNVDDLEATLDRLAKTSGAAMSADATYNRILRAVTSNSLPSRPEEATGLGPKIKISNAEVAGLHAANQAREILAFAEDRRVRVLATIKALDVAIGSLAGLPGRKALIYLTDGLPVRAGIGLADMWREKFESWALREGQRSVLDELTRVTSLSIAAESHLKKMGGHASAARVAFYLLSPGNKMSRASVSTESSASFRPSSTETFESQAPLLELAEMTGGKARVAGTDIAGLLADVRDDFGTFYSLGYKPKTEAKDGSRQIVVKVRGQPKAKVRYTRNLGDDDPIDQLRELTLSALYHGLSANPLSIELQTKPPEDLGNNTYRVDLMVKVPFEKLLLLPQEANHVGRLTLFVVVQDHHSQNLSNMSRVEVPLKIPNEQILAVMSQKAGYPLKLEMKGGSQRLAIGMRDHLGRVSATVQVDLQVPDSLAALAAPPGVSATTDPSGSGGAR